jgi:hypothetical protein
MRSIGSMQGMELIAYKFNEGLSGGLTGSSFILGMVSGLIPLLLIVLSLVVIVDFIVSKTYKSKEE